MTEIRSELASNVEKAILEDRRTCRAKISALDDDGVITLTGTAKDRRISNAAEEIARQVEGVLDVINEIEVTKEDLNLTGAASIPPHPPNK